jgi:hypothetical protein
MSDGTVVVNGTAPLPPPPEFTAVGCIVVEAHHVIECSTAPGAGSNIVWRLTIDGLTSQSAVTSYSPPSVVDLEMVAVRTNDSGLATPVDPVAALGALSTEGGEVIRINGTNFGPAAPASFVDGVWLGSGPTRRDLANCTFLQAHHAIECLTPPGVGTGHRLKVSVLAQASGVSLEALSYHPPTIASVLPASLPTTGTFVFLRGSNFGNDPTNTSLLLNGAVVRDIAFQVPHRQLRIDVTEAELLGVSSVTVQLAVEGQVRAGCTGFFSHALSHSMSVTGTWGVPNV